MSENSKNYDPFEAWRSMRDATMDAWSKTMIQTVNSDAYAKTTGALLDASLGAFAPMREMFEKAMMQTLQQLSMPTRADVVSLAERLTNIEMRLDDIDAKLDAAARRASPGPKRQGEDK